MIIKSEKEKMLAGEIFSPLDPQLLDDRQQARRLLKVLNNFCDESKEERDRLIKKLIFQSGPNCWIEPPFHCDYGYNITIGDRVFLNFNCIILDVAPVIIGTNVMFGPAVQIYTATHPLNAIDRRLGQEWGISVRIDDDVWVGGGAIICPGVHIGKGAVIGAGSVVTKNIPEGVVAVGNPCRVIRNIV